MARLFISYRRSDSAGYAGRLHNTLLKFYDKSQVFLDVEALEAGADFESVIMSELDACEVFIAVIGPRWVDIEDSAGNRRLANPSDYVRREVAGALQRDKAVVPVLVNRAEMPKKKQLPKDMRGLCRFNAAELSHGGFDDDVKRLVKSIGGGYGTVSVHVPRVWSPESFATVLINIKIDEEEVADRWRKRRIDLSKTLRQLPYPALIELPGSHTICSKELKAGRHTISASFKSRGMPPAAGPSAARLYMVAGREAHVHVPTTSRSHNLPDHHDIVSFKLKAGKAADFTFGCQVRTRGEAEYYRYSIKRM
jgi:hypothetical protein